jgi:hypothetical protein
MTRLRLSLQRMSIPAVKRGAMPGAEWESGSEVEREIQPLHGVASLIEWKRLERIVILLRVTEITVCWQNGKIVCNA